MCSIDCPLALLCAHVMYYVSVSCLTPALQSSANMLMLDGPLAIGRLESHWLPVMQSWCVLMCVY